jgi:hypothetical protein
MSEEKKEKTFVLEIVEDCSTKRVVGKIEVPIEEKVNKKKKERV